MAALASTIGSLLWWSSALLALWIAFLLRPPDPGRGVTVLGCAVVGIALWIAGMNLFANPAYTPAGSYHAALLIGGYLIGRRVDAAFLLKTGLSFAAVIAAWALVQQVVLVEARAHGPVVTPATLSTALNLVLVPGLVLVALGLRDARALGALALLAAALFASQSRGGWLAALAGAAIALLLARRAHGLAVSVGAVRKIVAILLTAALAAWACVSVPSYLRGVHPASEGSILGTATFVSRLELYELAWSGLDRSSLLGAGYRAFYYRVEAERQAVPSMGEGTTYFVHNDYLQTLFEFGVPGLAGLLVVVLGPLVMTWRRLPSLAERDARLAVAAAAGMASMAAHALVDFPFYLPLCVLMYALMLGFLDRTLATPAPAPRWWTVLPAPVRRGAVAGIATLAAWVLAGPAAAEAAATYGQRCWSTGETQKAAYWLEAARRFDSRDWRYHWYVGQFWAAQAVDGAGREAASRADRALAASVAANPSEVRSLLTRILLHRRLRALLAAPADPATLSAWADRAVELAPSDPGVRAERDRIRQQFARPKETG